MPDAHDAAERLARLERILTQHRPASDAAREPDVDLATLSLRSVPSERIRQLTSELQGRPRIATDAVDALAARVLLNDYTLAVSHLRTVARIAAHTVTTASVPIRRATRFIERSREETSPDSEPPEAPPADS